MKHAHTRVYHLCCICLNWSIWSYQSIEIIHQSTANRIINFISDYSTMLFEKENSSSDHDSMERIQVYNGLMTYNFEIRLENEWNSHFGGATMSNNVISETLLHILFDLTSRSVYIINFTRYNLWLGVCGVHVYLSIFCGQINNNNVEVMEI